jgi:5-oxoprolinase (ATP-hydrolysing)
MLHIQNNAEMSVRNLLKDVVKRLGKTELSSVDYLDDGTPVGLRLVRDSRHTDKFRSASISK